MLSSASQSFSNKQKLKKHGFTMMYSQVLDFVDMGVINRTGANILCAFIDSIDEKHESHFAAQGTIARKARCDRSTVNKWMNRLEDLGFIRITPRRFTSSIYELNCLDELMEKYASSVESVTPPCDVSVLNPSHPLCQIQQYPDPMHSDPNYQDYQQKGLRPLNSNLGNTLTKRKKGEDIGTRVSREQQGLVEETPIAQPPLNDTHALDAHALDAIGQEYELKIVRRSKISSPNQMVFKEVHRGEDGLITLELLTNATWSGLNLAGGPPYQAGKEDLRAAQEATVIYSKEKQAGVRPPKEKKSLSSRSSKKDDKFNTVYQRFYQACVAHGYDVPSRHFSNRNIDQMIDVYGVEGFAAIVECAVENWQNITKIIKSFSHRPVPTLGEISIPFVCEHLHAHLVAKKKGLLDKKQPRRSQRVKKSSAKSELGQQTRDNLLKLLADEDKEAI